MDRPLARRLRSFPLRPDPVFFFRFRGLFREQLSVSVQNVALEEDERCFNGILNVLELAITTRADHVAF